MANILVINAGSSSTKISRFAAETLAPETPVEAGWEADIKWDGDATEITFQQADGSASSSRGVVNADREALLREIISQASAVPPSPSLPGKGSEGETIAVVGHRVVHGGARYEEPTLVTPDVEAAIASLAPEAPAHNQAALQGMRVVREVMGDVPQVAVFDTAFHRTMPEAAIVYPGPYAWYEQGIRRFGFHGISHQYAAQQAARMLGRDLAGLDLITCHLGSGASLAAVHHGASVDTTMGFTPLDGIMMAERSGAVDPGILLHLLRQPGATVNALERALEHESGLRGVSGISGDMRIIEQRAREGDARAKLAFDVYIHRLRAGIGQMLAALGRVDAIVFTGGVGEHSAPVRAAACQAFACIGAQIDHAANEAANGDADLSPPGAAVRVLVVRARENWAIARACRNFIPSPS